MAVDVVTDGTFEQEVLRSELPVLVDLYADWCQPCKQIAPLVEALADKHQGKLRVVKLDIERNPMIAQALRIQSVPTLLLFQQGQLAGNHVGAIDARGLAELVRPVMPAGAPEFAPKDLAAALQQGRAVPVDIRAAEAFARYRIPGAIHVPQEQISSRLSDLHPGDGRLRVLYGRTSDAARTVAEGLMQQGHEVGFLEGGFLHWEADGFAVESAVK